ncbi:MAG TPA: TonB-dependent receptor, partial [Lacunisphaera sp.]|nr:TonB-dependent receptor [Lacunisphaera sp.]
MAQAVTNETPTAETLKKDEVLVLSPFTVQGDQQQGWTGKDTLSGAGLRTPLADIASAVSVVTPEFFADTASTNLRDVLIYQSNIEVGGMGGNAALTDESGREPSLGNEASTRVRGLATATSAR